MPHPSRNGRDMFTLGSSSEVIPKQLECNCYASFEDGSYVTCVQLIVTVRQADD